MLPYALRQLVWMLTSALQLIYALSTGIVWVHKMLRLFAYGACVGVCFIPHWWWYLTSPNIIRRVSYRSSDTTKRRNILRVLEAEGVDLHEVLRKNATPPPPTRPGAMSAAGRLRRGRFVDGPRSGSRRPPPPRDYDAAGGGGSSSSGGRRGCRRLPPPRRRPLSDAATVVVGPRRVPWDRDEVSRYATACGDGEVAEADPRAPGSGALAVSYPRGRSSSLQRVRRRRLSSQDCLNWPEEAEAAEGRGLHRLANTRAVLPSGDTQTAVATAPTALERLMEAAPVHLNPADGSALLSLPVQRPATTTVPTTAAAAALAKTGARGDDARAASRRHPRRPSRSPHCTPPMPSKKAAATDVMQSSSSSCDMTVNRPEGSSGEDERQVKCAAPATERADAGPQPSAYEGRPVYYDTLPKMELSNDPLLQDVLAALQEGTPTKEAGTHAAQDPRFCAYRDELQPAVTQGGGSWGMGGPNRPSRRSPQPRREVQPPPPQPQPQHTRTFSEENILAGLDEEDEEDKMNLHNRATVDIVLPVPLDSLMKTLEYTQHSKRLRRKRFPIVINVTGAVWIIGSHLWSTMMARVLAQRGYVVFCPDYRNFPQTTMEGMTLDVSDAVAWVLNNAERYNGDLGNVTLIGQSAGAHLTMMSLLSQAQLSAYRSNTLHGMCESVPPPSDVAYNVPRYNPRESIHRYVGLSGMYNIEGLVDHFQHEGLNTPVLYQIAGGRDQLARYSVHAYFDDRRGGDTGEVLPDNIFDYFPQRMFFMHGDADKCAPVTESATLVAMLRGAQARFAVRRSERNEEARRHALRSRRLLPGALSTTLNVVEDVGDDGGAHAAAAGGGDGAHDSKGLYRSWTSAWEEDGHYGGGGGSAPTLGYPPCYHNADSTFEVDLHPPYGYDCTGYGTPSGAGLNTAGQSIRVRDTSSRRGASSSSPPPPPQQQQQQRAPATIISPIVPPTRQDQPKPAVEVEFIVIPNGRHSDAFVDECIAANRSCCVDFLCDYESAVDFPTSSFAASMHHDLDGDSLSGSMGASSSAGHRAEHIPLWMAQSSEECAMPDGILPLAVPTEERSLPLRLCTLICPF